jgi:hypothetical protein
MEYMIVEPDRQASGWPINRHNKIILPEARISPNTIKMGLKHSPHN